MLKKLTMKDIDETKKELLNLIKKDKDLVKFTVASASALREISKQFGGIEKISDEALQTILGITFLKAREESFITITNLDLIWEILHN